MGDVDNISTKFTVLKNEDLAGVFLAHPYMEQSFIDICNKIRTLRRLRQTVEKPLYLVINTDEPYADEVIEILKKHGHWGS